MDKGIRPEIFDLVVDILRHRLCSLVFDWFPEKTYGSYIRVISDEVRTTLRRCVFNLDSMRTDDTQAEPQQLMFDVLEPIPLVAKVAAVYNRGKYFLMEGMPPLCWSDTFYLIYWACGLATLFKHRPEFSSAGFSIAYFLAADLGDLEKWIIQNGGWDVFRLECESRILMSGAEEENLRYLDNELSACFIETMMQKLPAVSLDYQCVDL